MYVIVLNLKNSGVWVENLISHLFAWITKYLILYMYECGIVVVLWINHKTVDHKVRVCFPAMAPTSFRNTLIYISSATLNPCVASGNPIGF